MDRTEKMNLLDEEKINIMDAFSIRHDIVIMIWGMQGEDGLPYPAYISESIAIYGYEAELFLTKSIYWADMIYEEDRKKAEQESYQNIINASQKFVQEYRVLKKDGTLVWVHADCFLIRDRYKRVEYVETIITNIDKQKAYERRLLANQEAAQQEVVKYQEDTGKKSTKEKLLEFIQEQKIELLQNAFTEIYGIHAAIIGLDYYFYTNMSGSKEEGIFYDIGELRGFRKKIEELNEAFSVGRKNAILMMSNPVIKIAGVPILYKNRQIATWIMCCLADRQNAEILKILQFMRILAENMSEYYNNYMEGVSLKGYASERNILKTKIAMQEEILQIYEEIQDISSKETVVQKIFQTVGNIIGIERIAVYSYIKDSIYSKCEYEWIRQDILEDPDMIGFVSVKALPSPKKILDRQKEAVINSIWIPKEWRDTFNDLNAKAVVLLPLKFSENNGFLCFLEELEDRVWKEEEVEFFKKIKKIIEKVLLKSE